MYKRGKFSHKSKKQLQWRIVKSSLWRSENTENSKAEWTRTSSKSIARRSCCGKCVDWKASQRCDRGQQQRSVGASARGPYGSGCGGSHFMNPTLDRLKIGLSRFVQCLTDRAWNKPLWTRSMAYREIENGQSVMQRPLW